MRQQLLLMKSVLFNSTQLTLRNELEFSTIWAENMFFSAAIHDRY